jgi:hypothetical protein
MCWGDFLHRHLVHAGGDGRCATITDGIEIKWEKCRNFQSLPKV